MRLLLSLLFVSCAAPLPIGATLQPIPSSQPTSAPIVRELGPCMMEFDFDVDGVMDGRRTYQYDKQGLLLREDFVSLGHKALSSSQRYKYDASGNQVERLLVIEEKAYTRNTNTYQGGRLIQEEQIYLIPECASGPVMKREFISYSIPSGDPTRPARREEDVFEYDRCSGKDGWLQSRNSYLYLEGSANIKQKKVETFAEGERGTKEHTIIFSYDATGRLQEELYTAPYYKDGYARVKHLTPISSPSNGAEGPTTLVGEVQTIEYDWDFDGVFERKTVMTYNASGKVTQEERFEGAKLKWKMSTSYDAKGRKIKEEVDGSGTNTCDGKIDHRSVYQYECLSK